MYLMSLANLRMAFDLPMPGNDEELDRKLFVSVRNFFDANWYLDEMAADIEHKKFIEWLSKDPTSRELRNKYFAILHWSSPYEDHRCLIQKLFRQLNDIELIPLSNGDVWKLSTDIRTQWQVTRKYSRESKAQKIDLRLQDLTMIIPWISAALICSGYVYTVIIYKHFGIDPSGFFSVGDYLAASLEQIDHALFALLGYVLGVIHGYRRQFMFARDVEEKGWLRKWWSEILITGVGWLCLISAYLSWDILSSMPVIHIGTLVVLMMATQTPLYLIAEWYFKNSLSVGILSMVIIIFFGSMFVGAKIRVSEIASIQNDTPFEFVYGDKVFSHESHKVIGTNSRYMFIWDRGAHIEVLTLASLAHISFFNREITSPSQSE